MESLGGGTTEASAQSEGSRVRSSAWYFVACLPVVLGFSGLAVLLWSDMGQGEEWLQVLQRHSRWSSYLFAAAGLMIAALYLMDFFCPPSGDHYCTLGAEEGAPPRGRALLGIVVLMYLAAVAISNAGTPSVPLLITIFLCPSTLLFLRHLTTREAVDLNSEVPDRERISQQIADFEADEKNFYLAATCAFVLAALLWVGLWVHWGFEHSVLSRVRTAVAQGFEQEMIWWASPAIVAGSFLVFSAFTLLRVLLNEAYSKADGRKGWLARLGSRKGKNPLPSGQEAASVQTDESKPDHVVYQEWLARLMRMVVCSFVALIGGVYVWNALAVSLVGSLVAATLQELLGATALTFIAFAVVSFRRLFHSVAQETASLPVVVSASSLGDAIWVRALAVCLGLPALPVILAVSCVNQAVRRLRGRAGAGGLVTDRVASALGRYWSSDWLLLIWWTYLWSLALAVSRVTPVLLNVFLAWLRKVMGSWPYQPIVLGVYCLGMVLFLLPPVPGPPIYIFSGMVISQKCPGGFWEGAASSVALCFAMKMSACAIQQKVIGGLLGSLHSVRQAVGVHRPFVRAIELILRREGLSFGKCAVLCGGPDWPTSVLAGILRLSLWQCLLGTCPVVLSIVPMSLTGSFLNKRHLDSRWYNAGNLMFYVTLLVSIVFWAGSAWAVQEAFDLHGEAIRAPRADCVHLDWLDHRASFIDERSAVKWEELPGALRGLYLLGALSAVLVADTFAIAGRACFGSVKVTASIDQLQWLGPEGVVRDPGIAGLAVMLAAGAAYLAVSCWIRRAERRRATQAAEDVDSQEAAWKERRLKEAHEAAAQQSLRHGEAAEGGASDQPLLGMELASVPPLTRPSGDAAP